MRRGPDPFKDKLEAAQREKPSSSPVDDNPPSAAAPAETPGETPVAVPVEKVEEAPIPRDAAPTGDEKAQAEPRGNEETLQPEADKDIDRSNDQSDEIDEILINPDAVRRDAAEGWYVDMH